MRRAAAALWMVVLSTAAGCGGGLLDAHLGDDPSEESVIRDAQAFLGAHPEIRRPGGEIDDCTVALRGSSYRRYVCTFAGAAPEECVLVELGTSGPDIEDGGRLRVDSVWPCRPASG